jgi:hypothetical protein
LIWNRDRAAVCKNFRDNCFSECRPAFSQDGRFLALSCTDWTVQLWDASSIATTVAADGGDSDGRRLANVSSGSFLVSKVTIAEDGGLRIRC